MNIKNKTLEMEASILAAMQDKGIEPTDDIIMDGELHRVYSDGDSAGSKNIWYVFHVDAEMPYGFYGHWRDGEKGHVWTLKAWKTLTDAEKKELERLREAHRLEREAELEVSREKCRRTAALLWKKGTPCTEHPYLARKGINAHGVRVLDGSLMIPLGTPEHLITGLQFIDAEGQKRFLPGTEKGGASFTIPGSPDKVALCEGFATGASIHEATGMTVKIAFDAGNLEKVALELHESLPTGTEIIICADNDHGKSTNTGLVKGNHAASLIGARLAHPRFPEGAAGTDFNDLHLAAGLDAVRKAIESADEVAELSTIELPAPITENCTEVTNSVYLTHAIMDKAVFVPENNQWADCKPDGFWEFDSNHVVEEEAKRIRDIWLRAAKAQTDEKAANALMNFSKKTASAAGITAMLKLASSQPHVRIRRPHFDSNPLVIGVLNGVVNLETLSFRQAKPSDYVSKRLSSNYLHGATCPRWINFLRESVGADTPAEREAMVTFLQ